MSEIDVLNRRFRDYLAAKPHEFIIKEFLAYQLGPVTAAVAAHGVTDVWQGIPVIPLADADEIHAICTVPPNADLRHPVYLRWLLIPNAATSVGAITTTIDKVNTTRNWTGSSTAGDGATALSTTIPAVIDGETAINVPFASDWGKIAGVAQSAYYDMLFIKLVAGSMTGADILRVFGLQVAFKMRKFAGRRA